MVCSRKDFHETRIGFHAHNIIGKQMRYICKSLSTGMKTSKFCREGQHLSEAKTVLGDETVPRLRQSIAFPKRCVHVYTGHMIPLAGIRKSQGCREGRGAKGAICLGPKCAPPHPHSLLMILIFHLHMYVCRASNFLISLGPNKVLRSMLESTDIPPTPLSSIAMATAQPKTLRQVCCGSIEPLSYLHKYV